MSVEKARPNVSLITPAASSAVVAANSAAAAANGAPPAADPTGKTRRARTVAASGPVNQMVPATSSKAMPSITLDAVSLIEMANHSVSGGKFTATVPLREGDIELDFGLAEPIKLHIPADVVAVVEAKLKPTSEGLLPSDISIAFKSKDLKEDMHLLMTNPGLFLGGGVLGGVLNSAVDVKVARLGIDDSGLLQPYGILKKPSIFSNGESPLEDSIPKSMLPKYDLHLSKLFGRGKSAELPKMPKIDPSLLLATLGGIVEQAKFELSFDGPSSTIAVNTDGAEIQSPAGHGSLTLTGNVKRDVDNTLVGSVSGDLNASVAATIKLAPDENAVAANGMTIGYRDQRLMVDAGGLNIARAIAGQVAVFVGNSLSLDATTTAKIDSELKLSFNKDGSLNIAANNATATLGLSKAAASSPHFTLALGDPSSATFKLAELGLGSTGFVARGADGSIDLKVESGQLDLGGAKFAVQPGRLGLKGKAESAESGGSVAVAYDLPVSAAIAGAKATGRFAGTFEMNLAL